MKIESSCGRAQRLDQGLAAGWSTPPLVLATMLVACLASNEGSACDAVLRANGLRAEILQAPRGGLWLMRAATREEEYRVGDFIDLVSPSLGHTLSVEVIWRGPTSIGLRVPLDAEVGSEWNGPSSGAIVSEGEPLVDPMIPNVTLELISMREVESERPINSACWPVPGPYTASIGTVATVSVTSIEGDIPSSRLATDGWLVLGGVDGDAGTPADRRIFEGAVPMEEGGATYYPRSNGDTLKFALSGSGTTEAYRFQFFDTLSGVMSEEHFIEIDFPPSKEILRCRCVESERAAPPTAILLALACGASRTRRRSRD